MAGPSGPPRKMVSIFIILQDGKFSCAEGCGLCCVKFGSFVMVLTDFGMLLWVRKMLCSFVKTI